MLCFTFRPQREVKAGKACFSANRGVENTKYSIAQLTAQQLQRGHGQRDVIGRSLPASLPYPRPSVWLENTDADADNNVLWHDSQGCPIKYQCFAANTRIHKMALCYFVARPLAFSFAFTWSV